MLSAIRALARSPIVGGFIIALLVAAFALFGVNDIFRGANNAAIAVGTERVGVQELQRAYEREILAIQAQNPRFTREQADQLGLGDRTISRLASEAAVQAKARELGIAVSDQQVIDQLRQIDAFRNPFTGEFDPETYLATLGGAGYTGPRAGQIFEAELRDELLRIQVLTAIFGGVEAPGIMTTSRRAFQSERRAISALLVPASLAGQIETPDDETLANFIAENALRFQQPEQRRFTLVRFDPLDFTRDVEIPEDDLQALYEFQLETGVLADPATRSITQWITGSQAEGEAAVVALQSGQTPEDIGLGQPVVLEDLQAFEIPDMAISDAAFARGTGDVFAVEGRLGWRVVRVDAATDPNVPSFESQRNALVQELSQAEAEGLMADALQRFEEARSQGLNFEDAGAAAQVPVESFDFITARGLTVEAIPAVTLQRAPEILQAIFEAPPNFETDPEIYGQNSYFMIRVDDIIESRVPDLDDVRADALSLWTRQQIAQRTQVVMDDALARVEAGADLNTVASTLPGTLVEAAILGRGESSGPFSADLVNTAFARDVGAPFQTVASDPTTGVIAVVTDVIVPPSTAFDPVQQVALSEEMGGDITFALQNALTTSYEVQTNQQLIDLALGRIDPNTLQ